MFYLGFVKNTLKDVVIFRAIKKPTQGSYPFFLSVLGPYNSESAARLALKRLKGEGYRENPAVSERQRRFMCSELGRLRSGKRTRTGMRESQLRDFCQHNPKKKCTACKIPTSQIRRGTAHELEHTSDRAVARQIAMDHLREDPYYYTHLAKMQKQYKRNPMSAEKAIRLTKKVYGYAKDIYKDYKENPGSEFHNAKFTQYMEELKNYEPGSVLHISLLARAYEHLESARESYKVGMK